MENTKPCSVCKQVLAYDNFPVKRSTKSGRASACRVCSAIQKSASYRRNIEHNKSYQKAYYSSNKSQIIARVTQWAKDNPDKQYQRNRKWLISKAGLANNYSHTRRAKLKATDSFFIRQSFLARLYSSACIYCGATQSITADHVIPIDKGGRHSEGNLVPACKTCNSSKGALFITEWKRKRATPKRDPQS